LGAWCPVFSPSSPFPGGCGCLGGGVYFLVFAAALLS